MLHQSQRGQLEGYPEGLGGDVQRRAAPHQRPVFAELSLPGKRMGSAPALSAEECLSSPVILLLNIVGNHQTETAQGAFTDTATYKPAFLCHAHAA